MRIAFDLRTRHKSGVFRYGFSLLAGISRICCERSWQLDVYTDAYTLRFLFDSDVNLASKCEVIRDDFLFLRKSTELRSRMVSRNTDVYFTPYYLFDLCIEMPVVFTFYDFIRLRHPSLEDMSDEGFALNFGESEFEFLRASLARLEGEPVPQPTGRVFQTFFERQTRAQMARAAKCVTLTRAVAEEVCCAYGVKDDHLAIVPGGVNLQIFTRTSRERAAATWTKYSVQQLRYLLYVGLTRGRKRFDWVLKSFQSAVTEARSDALLVVVGMHCAVCSELSAESASGRGKIIVTGFVSDDELAHLYSGAAALVVPSAEEGFCLPVLEALCCGAEVIAPDIGPIREVAESAAHFFPVNCLERFSELVRLAVCGSLPRANSSFDDRRWSWDYSSHVLAQTLESAACCSVD